MAKYIYEYKNWTDLKAQDETQNSEVKKFFTGSKNKINAFIQRKNSATNKYFQDSILKNVEYANTAKVCSTSFCYEKNLLHINSLTMQY